MGSDSLVYINIVCVDENVFLSVKIVFVLTTDSNKLTEYMIIKMFRQLEGILLIIVFYTIWRVYIYFIGKN